MIKKIFLGVSCVVMTTAFNSYAFQFSHPLKATVSLTSPNVIKLNATSSPKKNITLMNIQLTDQEKQRLFAYNPQPSLLMAVAALPKAVNLGMNGVPVLDQGAHGDCVTFAVTAAIDAVLGKGDYVSQLCNLELGSTLADNGYYSSGWDGAFAPMVLDQMMRFGIVNKNDQQTKSCAYIKDYPVNNPSDTGNPMPLDEFKQMSEDLTDQVDWISEISVVERFELPYADTQANQALTKVKQALVRGDRTAIGVFVIINSDCEVGACATYHNQHDTWALTKELNIPDPDIAGHEMVVLGYDDNAVATDRTGKKHQGLLRLRNSWSADVGDQGDFYISYDYFKKFLIEASEIVKVQ